MAQKYRIYINDSTLIIGSKPIKALSNAQLIDSQNFDFLTFYSNVKNTPAQTYYLPCDKAKKMLKTIKRQCQTIKAGGGLVYNPQGQILIIYRNNKWDLPKGKIEEGEKLKHTAVREVEEECGVNIAHRHQLICKTFHIYELQNQVCLKQTNWYKMDVKDEVMLTPQVEEGIEKVEWLNPNQLTKVVENTFQSILDVLKKAKHI